MRIEPFSTPNYAVGRKGHSPRGVVVHTNVGSFGSTVNWFATRHSRVSAHYLVGLDGRVAQFVDEADTAYHAGRMSDPTALLLTGENPNLYTIGIEFEDGGEPMNALRTDQQYAAGAVLIRSAADRWKVPLDRDHVVGHREIYARKSCPGNMDIQRLIDEATTVGAS